MPDFKGNYIHLGPNVDIFEHKLDWDCWCKPERDELAPHILIHHDLLADYQSGERKLN